MMVHRCCQELDENRFPIDKEGWEQNFLHKSQFASNLYTETHYLLIALGYSVLFSIVLLSKLTSELCIEMRYY